MHLFSAPDDWNVSIVPNSFEQTGVVMIYVSINFSFLVISTQVGISIFGVYWVKLTVPYLLDC